jgi:hypothetical protein
MKIFGSRQLEAQDLGESLQFVLTRSYGWFDVAGAPLVVGGFCFFALYQQSVILMILATVGVIGLVANWVHGRETILRVSPRGILVRGNLDSWFTTEIHLPIEEIKSLGWSIGGEGDNGGIYVSRGFLKQAWVLPGATEEQGREIIAAIADKFPDFPISDREPASILFELQG